MKQPARKYGNRLKVRSHILYVPQAQVEPLPGQHNI